MRIALVTACFGSIDVKKNVPKQSVKFDRFFFDESSSPYPLHSLSNRMKAKYFKCQMHKAIPGYDLYIWIDGSVQITSSKFIESIVKQSGDFTAAHHPERSCIYKEADFIMSEIVSGNKYLADRYSVHSIEKEINFYREQGYPSRNGLFEGGIFSVKNTPKMNKLMDKWWDSCLRWSDYDQFSLRYLFEPSILDVRRHYKLVNHLTVSAIENPRFSIVIPTYEQKGKGYLMLSKLLHSIRQQKCKYDFEIVISDNSEDNKIKGVAERYSKYFKELTYVRNKKRGIAHNTNHAIHQAKYDIIKPMYMDDVFLEENALNAFCEKIKTSGWVISNSYYISERNKIRNKCNAVFNPNDISFYNTVGMPSVIMFRKSELRFDPRFKTVVDLHFYYLLHKKFGEPSYIKNYLIGQRCWKGSISSNQKNNAHLEIELVRKDFEKPALFDRAFVDSLK